MAVIKAWSAGKLLRIALVSPWKDPKSYHLEVTRESETFGRNRITFMDGFILTVVIALQCGGQSGVWTASVIILSIGSWVGRVGPRPADGETAHLTSPKERLETVRQVLSEVPLIDGHNDLPWNIRNFVHNQLADFDFEKDLRQVAPWSKSAWSQTDLVRLRQGMVGGQVICPSMIPYYGMSERKWNGEGMMEYLFAW